MEPHEAKKKSFDLGGNRTTICVPSATRHNIHMYPYFLFAAIHHLKSSPTFSVRPCSSVGRVTVDLIRRSWVRFPPRSKDFFFASCGSMFPFTRANAQWVIHGFKYHFNLHFRVNSLFHYLCSQCYAAQHSYVPLLPSATLALYEHSETRLAILCIFMMGVIVYNQPTLRIGWGPRIGWSEHGSWNSCGQSNALCHS